jgi:hypothetical protein
MKLFLFSHRIHFQNKKYKGLSQTYKFQLREANDAMSKAKNVIWNFPRKRVRSRITNLTVKETRGNSYRDELKVLCYTPGGGFGMV